MAVQRKGLLTAGAFAGLGFMGMSRTFLGTALPAIRSGLNLSLFQAGSLPAMLQLGFSVAVFIGGPLSDFLSKRRLLMVGLFLVGTSFLLFGFSLLFLVNLGIVVLMGVGGGLIESSSNPLLIRLFPGRESTVMNLHHFFFATGSLVGPVVMGTLLAREIPWRWGYLGFGCLVIMILVLLAFSGKITTEKGQRFSLKAISHILRHRALGVLLFFIFFSSGVQNGIAYWMVTFLREFRGFSIALASTSLSLFFICLAMGRLSTSYLITRFREIHYMIGLLCLLAPALLLAIVIKGKVAILFFALCGLFYSGIFPTSLGVTGKIFAQNPGTPMGLMATAAGLGATLVPWFMSLVSELTTLGTGFMVFEGFVLLCIALLWFSRKRLTLALYQT